jgi:hypothetical protein
MASLHKELAIKAFDIVLLKTGWITDQYLSQFQVVIFLNTTGNIFDTTQQKVMSDLLNQEKVVGIRSASDTEYDWEWYTNVEGCFHTSGNANRKAEYC